MAGLRGKALAATLTYVTCSVAIACSVCPWRIFSQEEFDDIEREFTEFLDEHLQNRDLEAFRVQY